MTQPEKTALLAFGGNVTRRNLTPKRAIELALGALSDAGIEVRAVSRLYRTPAEPRGSGPPFTNAAAVVRTALGPCALLDALHRIEARLGRVRGRRWQARTLDIDLLGVDELCLPDRETALAWRRLPRSRWLHEAPPELVLPHPRLADRSFVLVPLAEIAPDWRDPLSGCTVRQMRDLRPAAEKAKIVPVAMPRLSGYWVVKRKSLP